MVSALTSTFTRGRRWSRNPGTKFRSDA